MSNPYNMTYEQALINELPDKEKKYYLDNIEFFNKYANFKWLFLESYLPQERIDYLKNATKP